MQKVNNCIDARGIIIILLKPKIWSASSRIWIKIKTKYIETTTTTKNKWYFRLFVLFLLFFSFLSKVNSVGVYRAVPLFPFLFYFIFQQSHRYPSFFFLDFGFPMGEEKAHAPPSPPPEPTRTHRPSSKSHPISSASVSHRPSTSTRIEEKWDSTSYGTSLANGSEEEAIESSREVSHRRDGLQHETYSNRVPPKHRDPQDAGEMERLPFSSSTMMTNTSEAMDVDMQEEPFSPESRRERTTQTNPHHYHQKKKSRRDDSWFVSNTAAAGFPMASFSSPPPLWTSSPHGMSRWSEAPLLDGVVPPILYHHHCSGGDDHEEEQFHFFPDLLLDPPLRMSFTGEGDERGGGRHLAAHHHQREERRSSSGSPLSTAVERRTTAKQQKKKKNTMMELGSSLASSFSGPSSLLPTPRSMRVPLAGGLIGAGYRDGGGGRGGGGGGRETAYTYTESFSDPTTTADFTTLISEEEGSLMEDSLARASLPWWDLSGKRGLSTTPFVTRVSRKSRRQSQDDDDLDEDARQEVTVPVVRAPTSEMPPLRRVETSSRGRRRGRWNAPAEEKRQRRRETTAEEEDDDGVAAGMNGGGTFLFMPDGQHEDQEEGWSMASMMISDGEGITEEGVVVGPPAWEQVTTFRACLSPSRFPPPRMSLLQSLSRSSSPAWTAPGVTSFSRSSFHGFPSGTTTATPAEGVVTPSTHHPPSSERTFSAAPRASSSSRSFGVTNRLRLWYHRFFSSSSSSSPLSREGKGFEHVPPAKAGAPHSSGGGTAFPALGTSPKANERGEKKSHRDPRGGMGRSSKRQGRREGADDHDEATPPPPRSTEDHEMVAEEEEEEEWKKATSSRPTRHPQSPGKSHAHRTASRDQMRKTSQMGARSRVVAAAAPSPTTTAAEVVEYPRNRGPFSASLLRRILLFVSATEKKDMLEFGRVCRFWYYHSNFSPHWTYFRSQDYRQRSKNDWEQLPKALRASLAAPKVVTREQYVAERRELLRWRQSLVVRSWFQDIRTCLALGIVVAVFMFINYAAAFAFGRFLPADFASDTVMGSIAFVVSVIMALVEIMIVIVPLGSVAVGGEEHALQKDPLGRMSRALSWSELLVALSLVFFTILCLCFSRVRSAGELLRGSTYNMSMNAACDLQKEPRMYRPPSFVVLPSVLWDIRWRPLTTDPTQSSYIPYCILFGNEEGDEEDGSTYEEGNQPLMTSTNGTAYCYHLLYFDEAYASPAFQSTEGYLNRNIGTYTALGYDVFGSCSSSTIDEDDFLHLLQATPREFPPSPPTTTTMRRKKKSEEEVMETHETHPSLTPAIDAPVSLSSSFVASSSPRWPSSMAPSIRPKRHFHEAPEGHTNDSLFSTMMDRPSGPISWESYPSTVANIHHHHHRPLPTTSTSVSFSKTNATTSAYCSVWCANKSCPPVIAVSSSVYASLSLKVDTMYPTLSAWMNPMLRPTTLEEVSYQACTTIPYVRTPESSGFVNTYNTNPLWQEKYIPLVSETENGRGTFQQYLSHFHWYAYACWIISAGLWCLMVLGQFLLRRSPMVLLGVSTVIVALLLNPITMIIAGGVCVNASPMLAMCSRGAGGALIGGGLSLCFIFLTLYFALS